MIPSDWPTINLSSHDEKILVANLQEAGHPVTAIQAGWSVWSGQNADGSRHAVFQADDTNYYGVKCAQAVTNGAYAEYAMWSVAHLLQLPGASRPGWIEDSSILEYLSGKYYGEYNGPAVVTRWLKDSVNLFDVSGLNASRKLKLSHQIGEWWAFCVLTELGDRHFGNFVYSPTEKVFAAIDMESPFHPYSEIFYLNEMLEHVHASKASVKKGIESCADRIEANLANIKQILRDGKLTKAETRLDPDTSKRVRGSAPSK